MNIKLGTDPELFLKVGSTFVSAAGFFPGTKKEPYPLECGAVQVDGCALEFNIDAAEDEDTFVHNIKTVMAQLTELVQLVDKRMEMVFTPYANFVPAYWKTVEPEAKILGCDPDFNVNGQMNPNPGEILEGRPIRTAAGHIHIGWGEELDGDGHFGNCLAVAQYFHQKGVYAPVRADERARLKYYGNNGAFRPKKYGVELRSPSNCWVAEERTQRLMFQTTRETFREMTGM
jgi:hypothetical protein